MILTRNVIFRVAPSSHCSLCELFRISYVQFLDGCVQLGDPLEQRQKEEELRGPAIVELNYCINSFREAAQSKDAKYDHIDAADKEKVLKLSVLKSLFVMLTLTFLCCDKDL